MANFSLGPITGPRMMEGGGGPWVYLDANATHPILPSVADYVSSFDWRGVGNPSSPHRAGQRARGCVGRTRQALAKALNALEEEVIFTGTGTEANAMVLRGIPVAHHVVSAIEHTSVLRNASSAVTHLPVTPAGVVDTEVLDKILASTPAPALVSVMVANNETGVIQPLQDVVRIARTHGAYVHTDAIAAFGKVPLDFATLGVDALTVSAHKIGALPGLGALLLKQNVPFSPLYRGGGQERGLRSGTENVLGIGAFGVALESLDASIQRMSAQETLRDYMEAALRSGIRVLGNESDAEEGGRFTILGSKVEGGGDIPRLPNTSCIVMHDVESTVQMITFDMAGICVSAGSSCSSGKIAPSHVLQAMGMTSDLARRAIRVSLTRDTTRPQVDKFVSVWLDIYRRHGRSLEERPSSRDTSHHALHTASATSPINHRKDMYL